MNNLNTKNLFTTKRLFEEITTKLTYKTNLSAHLHQYKYLYIISKIITDKSLHKGNYIGCKLNIKNLTVLFGTNHSQTCAIIKDLAEWNVIHKTANAVRRIDAARYALTKDYSEDNILVLSVDISDANFIKKLIDFEKIESDKTIKQLGINTYKLSLNSNGVSYLLNKYKLPTIDGGANEKTHSKLLKREFIDNNKCNFLLGGAEIEIVDLPLIQIYLKNFNTSRPDPRSRVFNNLTNLKREFRKYILFNNAPLLMTDISNSQVLFSAAAVRKQYSIISGIGLSQIYDDVNKYQQLAETGNFYEYLIEKSKYEGDRNKFKKDFFSQVFFSKVVKYSMPIKDIFISEFPNVYKLINQLKAKNYKDFAISMQRMEASIMIDNVAKKMIKAGKCILTLHDAIVCNNEADLELAEELISNAIEKLGLKPKFKREATIKQIFESQNDVLPIEEEYNPELDTVTVVLSGRTYYFGNNSIIASNLFTSSEVIELRNKLIASDAGNINYKGKLYKFSKFSEGNETMILLVA